MNIRSLPAGRFRPLVLPSAVHDRKWVEFDGIRAIALIVVTLYHLFVVTRPTWNPLEPGGGYLGVDIFYVLSGFLITSLLLSELARADRVNLRAFWGRRALRILPPLLVLLFVVGMAMVLCRGQRWVHPTRLGFPWVVLYVGNWNAAFYGGQSPLGALGHTWSLSVEEQFYLIWPAVFVLVARRFRDHRKVAWWLAAAAVAEWLYRFAAVKDHWSLQRVYFSTDLHSDGLILGCALAFWISSRQGRSLSIRWGRAVDAATLAAIVVLAGMVMRESIFVRATGAWLAIPLTGVCTAVVMTDIVLHPLPAVSGFLRLRPLVWLGRRSYGMYLWVTALEDMLNGFLIHRLGLYGYNAALFVFALAVTAFSYRFIELPFLRLKSRFREVPARATLSAVADESLLQLSDATAR